MTQFHDNYDGLIANDILLKNDVEIHINKKILRINEIEVPICFNKQDELLNEYINETKCIPFQIHFAKGIDDGLRLDHLNSEEQHYIKKTIFRFKDVFFKEGDDLTFTNKIKHELPITNDGPIYTKNYRYPHVHGAEVEKQINDMLKQKIIRKSNSPYNSPIWIVPKKTDASGKQKWRMVIDYRKLNNVTKEDKFPIPNIDDMLGKLGHCNYFTTLDLAKGFHQIEIHPKDIDKTAFSTADGHYEFLRMPFGLKNAPATFQRMMNEILREFIGKICYVYLDDIIIFSTSLQEHISAIEKIFKRLREVNLKVQLDKTEFLKKETEFLGHVVTPDGIKANPNKIKAIIDFPIPKTIKEIQSFLGLTGYYRKFIQDYAKIVKPITLCLKKDNKI